MKNNKISHIFEHDIYRFGSTVKSIFKVGVAVLISASMMMSSISGLAVKSNDADSQSAQTTQSSDNSDSSNNSDNSQKTTQKQSNPDRKQGEKPALGDGETGILIDSASGRVLFEKDSTKRMYPASTTKVMTALLTIESIERGEISLDTQIEVTA